MKKCYFDRRPIEFSFRLKGIRIIECAVRVALIVAALALVITGGTGCNRPSLPVPGNVIIPQPPDVVTERQVPGGANVCLVMPPVLLVESLPNATTNIFLNGLPSLSGSVACSSFPPGETKVTIVGEVSAPNRRGSLGSTNFSVFVVDDCQPVSIPPVPALPQGFAVVTSFRTSNLTGEVLSGQLVEGCDERLYGTTSSGGSAGLGTIFAMTKDGSNAVTLLSITNAALQGNQCYAGLTRVQIAVRRNPSNPQAGSEIREALFGTMLQGGANGKGTLFCVLTNHFSGGYEYRVLHHFGGTSGPGGEPDGGTPTGLLLRGSDGLLYGTTTAGGTNDGGTLFRISREGQLYRIVRHFGSGPEGKTPWAGVVEGPDGLLYGTTRAGGAYQAGTVYKVAKDGTGFQVLHSFRSTVGPGGEPADGSSPLAGLLFRDGFFYGATIGAAGAGSYGNFFRLRPNGTEFELIYLLEVNGGPFLPWTSLAAGPDGALYGVTSFGCGVLFRLRQPSVGSAWVLDELRRFSLSSGCTPQGSPIFASDGSLYGTTEKGGSFTRSADLGPGVVYRWTPPLSQGLTLPDADLSAASDVGTELLEPVGAADAGLHPPGWLIAKAGDTSYEVTVSANEPGANAGRGVALSGDILVVGVPNRTNTTYSGAAFVFERSPSNWVERARLTPSGPEAAHSFGYSATLSGETALIGAPSFQSQSSNSESAYVFIRTNGLWRQQARLVSSSASSGATFGMSVALHGNTAVVGAPTEVQNGLQVGAAYVYLREGTNWSRQARLVSPVPVAAGYFGASVAIHGNTAVVGSPRSSGFTAPTQSGDAYVFVRVGTNWSLQQKIVGSSQSPADLFGASVAVHGDTAAIGAPGMLSFDGTDRFFGFRRAYVFERVGNSWTEEQVLAPTGLMPFDLFGCSVAVDSNRIAVGAAIDWRFVTNRSGGAYIFEREESDWEESERHQPTDIQPNDTFGLGLALTDTSLAVGASTRTNVAAILGSVFVFDRKQTIAPPTLTIVQDMLGTLISWPSNANGFILESATNLAGPWQPVTPTPAGNSHRPADTSVTRFYRLRSP